MTVKFYTFSKRANSTAQPTGGTDYAVILKEGCSSLRPSVHLKYTGNNPTAYNYAYIADFGRYYYIDDWVYSDRQWTASMHVDVLATYKTDIGASSQYVTRSASDYDGGVVDTLYPAKSKPVLRSPSVNVWDVNGLSPVDQSYVVTTMSKQGWQEYYLMSGSEYATFASMVFASSLWNGYDFGDLTKDTIRAMASPEDAVVSVQWLPLKYSVLAANNVGTAVSVVPLGEHVISCTARQISPVTIYTKNASINLTDHPDAATRGSYLNGNSFTVRTLCLPTLGTIPIDSDLCIGCEKINITHRINLASGSATVIVTAQNTTPSISNLLGVYNTKLSIEYGYGTTRVDGLGMVQGMFEAFKGSAENLSLVGAKEGVGNALRSAFPHTRILNNSGSIGSYQSDAWLIETHYLPVDEDNADRGRPLCKVKQISTLSGFVQCADATLSLSCTWEELNLVLGYLNGGFFYE